VVMIEEAVEEVEMTVEAVVAVEEDKSNVKICKCENLQKKQSKIKMFSVQKLAHWHIFKLAN
jgi:hypothetical protein